MSDSIESQARETANEVIGVFVDDRMSAISEAAQFWDDAYVLGFLLCATLQLTQGRHGADLEPIAAADAVLHALGDASGAGVGPIKDRVGVLQNEGNLEYLNAMKAADKLVRFIAGSSASRLDPVVVAAREKAVRMRADGSLDPDKVSEDAAWRGVLVDTLFTDVVMDRFEDPSRA
ncbi:MAG: hypothetical protein JSU82_17005 [Rhodospirillales bacterium]|nr:MAG: hypothetical protein JSU82_17005 [Rhodospirillales bacterium]